MRMYLIGILIFVTAAVFAEEQKSSFPENCSLDHIYV